MINILFVCIGNICRSPLAEGIFQYKIEEKGLSSVLRCDSAGTTDYHIGSLPHPLSQQVALLRSIKLNHRARKIEKDDFKQFQYILTMEKSVHLEVLDLKRRFHADSRVLTMRSYDPQANGDDVPDPYYYSIDVYEEVYQILDRSCDAFLEYLIQNHMF